MGNCCSSGRPPRKTDVDSKQESREGVLVQSSEAVPSARQYYMKTGKKTVEILQTAATLAPVPFVREALDVVLTLIGVCEEMTAIQGQLDDLKDRLGSLGLIIFDLVEGGDLPKASENRITKLRADLERITFNLQAIREQSHWVLGFFSDTNKESVDDCLKRVTVALDEFHLSHDITTEQDLHRILQRLEDMSSQLKHVDEGVQEANRGIEEIKALMKNTQPHSAPVPSFSGMPVQLAHFRGRRGMIAAIGNFLCGNPTKTHVAVLATGGMGKTTVAVEVMESDIVKCQFDTENRFWVSCKGATSIAIFMQILATSLRVKTNLGNLNADIQAELTASNAPRLVILDNFETPWETSDRDAVETVLWALAKLSHVAILVTMRSNFPPSQNIVWHVEALPPVDVDASRQIYTDVDPSAAGHEALDKLLNALGHMPYAIKLVANLGKESKSAPDALLRIWKEAGTEMLGGEIDRSISLSVDGLLIQSHPEARSLLVVLSMLPAGATRDHLDFWAPGLRHKKLLAVSILNRTALISEAGEPSNPTYFVYPVVQSYMEHSGRILVQDRVDLQVAAFKFILDHKSSPGDPQFKDALKALASEDVNLQGILMFAAAQRRTENRDRTDGTSDSRLLDSLLAFGLYQLWSKPALDVAQLAVDVARHLDSKLHLAEALNCLGQILNHLADYDGAIAAFEEARELFTSLPSPLRSAQTTFLLMDCYFYCQNASAGTALEQKVRTEIRALGAKGDRQLRAIGLATIGNNLWLGEHYKEALKYLHRAQKTFGSTVHSFEAAQCLYLVCRCCAGLKKYSEAIDAAKLAMKEFEYLGLDVQRNDAWAQEGICLLMLQDYEKALHVAQGYLQEARRLGDAFGTAQALEFIAQLFEQKGDVALVELGYKSALEQYKIIGGNTPFVEEGKKRCEHNLLALAKEVAKEKNEDGANDYFAIPLLEHLTFV